MLDLSWSEILLVAVLALVFVGPKDLPALMRGAGRYAAKLRGMAGQFRQSFEDMAKQAELDELSKEAESLRARIPAAEGELRASSGRFLSGDDGGEGAAPVADKVRP